MAGKVTKYVGRSKTRAAAAAAAAGASKGKGKGKQLGDSEEEGEETGGEGGTANFQDVLNTVIEAIAVDHPHHALWQIFALSNGDRVVAAQKSKNRYLVDNDKATAAKGYIIIIIIIIFLQVVQFLISFSPNTDLLNRLRATKHKQLIQEMEKLIGAYIELAFMDVSNYKGEVSTTTFRGVLMNQAWRVLTTPFSSTSKRPNRSLCSARCATSAISRWYPCRRSTTTSAQTPTIRYTGGGGGWWGQCSYN